VEEHLDGSRTECFEVEPDEPTLHALLRELFEEHWGEVVFGPCLQGAVFEGRFFERPRVSALDGYLTAEIGGRDSWHFHLCIGPHRGTARRPTPPELAKWRRCGRAAFFRDLDPEGHHATWGFRMWNGRGEQAITVFFPNPWLDPTGRQRVTTPEWSRLELWMRMRERYAGVPVEPPPRDQTPPATH
jgi:hypothetical protein